MYGLLFQHRAWDLCDFKVKFIAMNINEDSLQMK